MLRALKAISVSCYYIEYLLGCWYKPFLYISISKTYLYKHKLVIMDLYSSFHQVENSTNMRACLGQPSHAGAMCNHYSSIAMNQDPRLKESYWRNNCVSLCQLREQYMYLLHCTSSFLLRIPMHPLVKYLNF